ncbi:MAG: cysteine hydrolase family protein [Kiloniellales bacterium]|nr:cysteine hydrolase family protein [Kiloniellales bacterium]
MTRVMTLLEMAGALRQPAALSRATVVVIDAQKEYDGGGLALPELPPKTAEIAALLARARSCGTPVIHVRHLGQPGGLFDPQGEGSEFLAAAAPLAGETIVEKHLPNAFAGTGLQGQIRRLGRDELIFVGFMTHMCISSSVRAAFDLGYACTVVASATGTRPLPKVGSAEAALAAETVHEAALAGLADRFAIVAEDAAAIQD